MEKNNQQGQRATAIEKLRSQFPEMEFETAAHCYDVKNIIGKVLGDLPIEKLLDLKSLSEELKARHKKEVANRKDSIARGIDNKKLPKLTVLWQLIGAINRYAGYAAKKYIDKSFESPKGMSVSTVRFNISGSANSHRWNKAVQPSKDQRSYGATGEPNYKKRCDGFSYQIPQKKAEAVSEFFRSKRQNHGYQIFINPIHKGNGWIDTAYHRPIPEGSKIKQMTINERAGHFFAVLSVEVPDRVWMIASMQAGWWAGIDPGASTALTIAFHNAETSETRQAAINYQFLEKSLAQLEKLQQCIAKKQGPRRKRTEDEVNKELAQFSKKQSIQKLPEQERSKIIAKKKEILKRK